MVAGAKFDKEALNDSEEDATDLALGESCSIKGVGFPTHEIDISVSSAPQLFEMNFLEYSLATTKTDEMTWGIIDPARTLATLDSDGFVTFYCTG